MPEPEIRIMIEPDQIPFQTPEPHVLRNMNRILHKRAPLFAAVTAFFTAIIIMIFANVPLTLLDFLPAPLLIGIFIVLGALTVFILTHALFYQNKVTGIITGKVTEHYNKNDPTSDLTGAQLITVLFDDPAGTACTVELYRLLHVTPDLLKYTPIVLTKLSSGKYTLFPSGVLRKK